jgi:hypothetical protein
MLGSARCITSISARSSMFQSLSADAKVAGGRPNLKTVRWDIHVCSLPVTGSLNLPFKPPKPPEIASPSDRCLEPVMMFHSPYIQSVV